MQPGKRRYGTLLLLTCLPGLLMASAPTPDLPPDPAAWRAAGSWLSLVDARMYKESWQEAARVFQAGRTARAWARDAAAMRQRAGSPISRELITTKTVTEAPDLPPGDYLCIRFECECSEAGSVRETLFMVQEAGRGWRVAGYLMEPA